MLLCVGSIYANEAVIKYTLAFSSQASINLLFLFLPHNFFNVSRLRLPARTVCTLGCFTLVILSPFTKCTYFSNILNILILVSQHEQLSF